MAALDKGFPNGNFLPRPMEAGWQFTPVRVTQSSYSIRSHRPGYGSLLFTDPQLRFVLWAAKEFQ